MRELRALLTGLAVSALGPFYLGLMAYTMRQAPWSRGVALLASAVLGVVAAAWFVTGAARWLLQPGGWAEGVLQVPPGVSRQLRRSITTLLTVGVVLLLPGWVLSHGLLTAGGRPIAAPALGRFLELGFALNIWWSVQRLVRSRSALVVWVLEHPERVGWLGRHRRAAAWSVLAAIGAVIVLDLCGYGFTARRLAVGAGQAFLVAGLCWGLYRLLTRAIDHQAWRWIRPKPAVVRTDAVDASGEPHDLPGRLRRLSGYSMPILGLFLCAWSWNVDWALFRFLSEQTVMQLDKDTAVTVGNCLEAALAFLITAVAWRHLSTLFAIAVFPRMPDDPGVRFAVLTLCRYSVLAVGFLSGLSAIHLGLAKIGMVLAALGVGLGFGLQEIVSNFVCGIILLLERPIRVGDIVTVTNMTGKVDRINIRATTIINGENQSMIIPNRAFITGDLINWTLKDKIIRASVRVKAACGTDPDRVTELLLQIAREDADVLRNPVPSSLLEDFSDSALAFVLHVHVPDPSLSGRVRHRLLTQIQKRFQEAGIEIPLPAREFLVRQPLDGSALTISRIDPAAKLPPSPHKAPAAPGLMRSPAAIEDCHRGVDE